MLYRFVRAVVALLARLLFRLEARGTECVPRSGPVLIVANHSSMLDPPIVGVAAPRPLHFLAKAELFSIPLLGRLVSALHARPVRRGASDPGALRMALKILQAGNALLIFPEGSRGEEGTLREGKPGAGMLAVLSGAPVVPAYVEGTGRILPRGRRLPGRGTIRVSFGPPLVLPEGTGTERKERYREATRQLMAGIARVKAAAEAGSRAAALGASAAGHAVAGAMHAAPDDLPLPPREGEDRGEGGSMHPLTLPSPHLGRGTTMRISAQAISGRG